jgi:hypothetical protein
MTFDHLMPNSWIPTALQIAKLVNLGAPILVGTHMLGASISPRSEAAKAIILAIGVSLLLAAPAFAQVKPPHVTGNLGKDIGDDIKDLKGSPGPVGTVVRATGAAVDPTAPIGICTHQLFGLLTPQNLVPSLQACGEKFLVDAQAALASAQTAKDQTGINCLSPAVPLIQAGIGTPGTPGSPGDPTATPPIAAVTAVPAEPPGFLLAFQKFREFVLAGGIAACQSYVGTVVAAQAGTLAGTAGLAAGALILAPKPIP